MNILPLRNVETLLNLRVLAQFIVVLFSKQIQPK